MAQAQGPDHFKEIQSLKWDLTKACTTKYPVDTRTRDSSPYIFQFVCHPERPTISLREV